MKFLIIIISLLSFSVFAEDDDEIKSKDLNNEEISASNSSAPSESISADQMETLKKEMDTIKENQKKSDAFLKELDAEK